MRRLRVHASPISSRRSCGRFERGLYFESEAHVDAQKAMSWLVDQLRLLGADIQFESRWNGTPEDVAIDCRGLAPTKIYRRSGVCAANAFSFERTM